jgi:teichuronic acid biosynthesis glycosyltransferase TuaH
MDFIFVSLQRINTNRSSTSTSLAHQLSKEHRVLYVNPSIDRKTWIKHNEDPFVEAHKLLIKKQQTGLKKDSQQLSVLTPSKIIESINWIPFTFIFSLFNKVNNQTFAGEIKQAIKQLNFKDYILIIDKDMFRSFYLKELLKPKHTLYLDRDYTLGFDYWKRHGVKLEPQLMAKCDAVVCNSLDFTKKDQQYNPASFYISNGADLEIFNAAQQFEEPKELSTLQRPLIGYVGALTASRLDISLIAGIARTLKKGTVVLIGPEDDAFKESELHQIPNIHFIAMKKTTEVAAYVNSFDVCINPQVLNEITIGNFPLKIVEYLAMGKPIVATETNTMREVFAAHTYLATCIDEYKDKIEQAMREDSGLLQQERISFSQNFSWKKVSNNLLAVIDRLG